ncbi:MAG TPA: ABC transporter permease [Firmicutes bacterium]|nr:ABC transporter permease [Candidatus Fermentithermobacillaceae bacterium]
MRGIRILERILGAIPIMLGVCIVVFLFMRLIPGDPVDIMIGEGSNVTQADIDSLKAQFNLDQPVHIQLLSYLSKVLRGDLGYSISRADNVSKLILQALPATVELAIAAMFFALLIGIPIGVLSAVKHNSAVDRASTAGAFLGISVPAFWLGIVLIIIFSVNLGILPTSGRADYGFTPPKRTGLYVLDSVLAWDLAALKNSLEHLILPAVALGAAPAAVITRVVRSSMLEVLQKDYVMFARAKGVPEHLVIVKHALRNALIPTVTVAGLEAGTLLGGNMIVETIFSWPGMGRLVVDGIFSRDYSLVQGAVMVYALTFVLMNLTSDILYTYLNPKISMEKGS